MRTLRLTADDFQPTAGTDYSWYVGQTGLNIEFDGHVLIAPDLGKVRFPRHIRMTGGLGVEPGTDLLVDWGVEVGASIETAGGLQAGWNIVAGLGIRTGGHLVAEDGIKAGWGIVAGQGPIDPIDITAGLFIEAEWGIEARSIQAGTTITCGGALDAKWKITAGRPPLSPDDKPSDIICGHLVKGRIIAGRLIETEPTRNR